MEGPPIAAIIGIVGAVAGISLILLGGRSVARQASRASRWRRERATVVGYDWRGADDHAVQHWRIERTDARGTVHRTTSQLGMSHGTMRRFPFDVDVLVDPHDESSFVLAGGCRSGWGGLLAVFAGLFTMLIAGSIVALIA